MAELERRASATDGGPESSDPPEGSHLWCCEKALAKARAEVERFRGALTKINEIRNSIVGVQGFNFSEHAYPLVAALNEAGFEGLPYPEAMANVGTVIERATKAEAEVERLRNGLSLTNEQLRRTAMHWRAAEEQSERTETQETISKRSRPAGTPPLTLEELGKLADRAYRDLGYEVVVFRNGSIGVLRCPAKTIRLMNRLLELVAVRFGLLSDGGGGG